MEATRININKQLQEYVKDFMKLINNKEISNEQVIEQLHIISEDLRKEDVEDYEL
jgi:hypothetical protein